MAANKGKSALPLFPCTVHSNSLTHYFILARKMHEHRESHEVLQQVYDTFTKETSPVVYFEFFFFGALEEFPKISQHSKI
jgi:hypothetical protein